MKFVDLLGEDGVLVPLEAAQLVRAVFDGKIRYKRGADEILDAVYYALREMQYGSRAARRVAADAVVETNPRSLPDRESAGPDGEREVLLSAQEFADLIGKSKKHVTEEARKGRIESRTVGGRYVFTRDAVNRYNKQGV